MTATAYPLTWPEGFPRAKSRERGAFKSTLSSALKNVEDSLRKFASDSGKSLQNVVISSNVTLGQQNPQDPGVAIWFTWDGLGVCIAVDRYQKVESNLQAIHHIIEARRVELRHGTLALVRASMTGFIALPKTSKDWWEVLAVAQGSSLDEVKKAYKSLCGIHHPDRKGGNKEMMQEINVAYEKALTELEGK